MEMQVGIVQVKEISDGHGGTELDLVAGAYNVAAPTLENGNAREKVWTMELQLDSDPTKRSFRAEEPAFGFALMKLRGGGFTGWIDQVMLKAP